MNRSLKFNVKGIRLYTLKSVGFTIGNTKENRNDQNVFVKTS